MEGESPPETERDDEQVAEASLFPTTVGEKLRSAREAQGLELAEIAARTRIPQRHLEAIEKSNYASLPSSTYAIGFAKAYARAIGSDEVAIGRELRTELGGRTIERTAPVPSYQMEDPTRTAPSGLVWISMVVALLVLAGVGVWYGTDWFRGNTPPPETLTPATEPTPVAQPTQAIPATGGQVTLTASDQVWLRVSDASGKRLFEKEMAAGERYDVPTDADAPVVRTGRADKINVTINGSDVPPLGPPDQTIQVPVSADALRARGEPSPTPTPETPPL